ncbi:MAG: serine/threonine protein kinase, partial [Immundisolibacteraceae bacterium]|nr:serine/threonine protein kinase [Immundisolibacteraceae bacterium]
MFSSIKTDKATSDTEQGTDQNNEASIDLDALMDEPDIEFGESEGANAVPIDDDATQVSSGNLDDDATQVAGASDDEATQMMADGDATEVVVETSGTRGTSSIPGGPAQTTGSSWSDPSSWEDNPEPLGVGSVIKDRFELTERLGIGGMGVVYKALDRRKVEAEDRDPNLAVKILNDEFKQHPKALQALQREARKTQELAHPNIMTVYDFDRVGSDVYMTMEFLDGDPMDVVIKKRKGKPFPEAEAMLMIEGMCEALAYAHRRNLVHSDFKPGNVFLTN